MSAQKPNLLFHFANSDEKVVPIYFSEPCRIITAWSITDVTPCLQAVEQAVSAGYYAAGYLSYEAAPAFNPDLNVNTEKRMPLLWFGIFEKPSPVPKCRDEDFKTGSWSPSVQEEDYYIDIDHILEQIAQGKVEQVNYTVQMESTFKGDAFSFYNQLKRAQDAKYTAYADIGDFTILSASPELFFRLNDQRLTTRPMKGTIKRGKTYQDDLERRTTLFQSEKDRIENELIVGLMKNELEMLTSPDNIKVTSLYELEQYPTVFQMTSTIQADLPPEKTITDIFRALFPSGSITGSPKKEATEIIANLEQNPREVYCGTLGFITPKKEAIFNVPIRTVTIDNRNSQAVYGAGGGITRQSNKEDEYREALAKTDVLHIKRPPFDLLETFGLFSGEYFLFEKHMERLKQSAVYFNYNINMQEIKSALQKVAIERPRGSFKIRLLAAKNGSFTIGANPLGKPLPLATARLAKEPINKEDVFFYHKTTNRQTYDLLKQHFPDVFDVLLYNNENEVTEFTTGNLVVEWNGEFYTPPVTSGLLAGTFRDKLICDGIIKESVLHTDTLSNCTSVWYINSVRGWIPVRLEV